MATGDEVARLAQQVGNLRETVGALKTAADNSRSQRAELFRQVREDGNATREALAALRTDIGNLSAVVGRVEALEKTNAETVAPALEKLASVEQQAIGAGRFGRILWAGGGALVGLAVAAVSFWRWLTNGAG